LLQNRTAADSGSAIKAQQNVWKSYYD